jgi:hypothetical protein
MARLGQRSRVERGTPTTCAARSAVSPAARALSHRATASRLLSASRSAVCAAKKTGRRSGGADKMAGQAKNLHEFSCDSSFDNPSLGEPHPSINPSHICLS